MKDFVIVFGNLFKMVSKKIVPIIMLVVFGTAIYLMLSVAGVPVPFPKWYEKMEKEQVDNMVAHDPFLKLAKTTIKLRFERDSLQHIIYRMKFKDKSDSLLLVVDSLKQKR